jgi:hypothetical protein
MDFVRAFERARQRFFFLTWPRRSGKDLTALAMTTTKMLQRVGNYVHIFPEQSQGRKALWNAIDNDGREIVRNAFPEDLVATRREDEMLIRLHNGSTWQVVGGDRVDSLVGSNIVGAVFSEFALTAAHAWPFIRPMLAANGGWAVFVTTPRGLNHAYDLRNFAARDSEWFEQTLTTDETKHILPEVLEQERRSMPEDLFLQEYYCFPGDTRVYTAQGQKPIADVRVDDVVLSHSARWRRVDGVMRRPYEGDLVVLRAAGEFAPLRCTPEHPVRVANVKTQTFEWRAAKDVRVGDNLVFPRAKPSVPFVSSELATLAAFYVAEGSASRTAVALSFGEHEYDLLRQARVAASALGFSVAEHRSGPVTHFIIHSTALADLFLREIGGISRAKRLPWTLVAGHESMFFERLMDGDGHRGTHRGKERWGYTTVSESLARDVRLLAHTLGYRAGVNRQERPEGWAIEGRRGNGLPYYTVNIAKPEHQTRKGLIRPMKHGIATRVMSVERESFKGDVFNLSVAIEHTYVAEGFAVHNCSWTAGQVGVVYSKELELLAREGQITDVPWDTLQPVHTFWDVGVDDDTAILFVQNQRRRPCVIDVYTNNNVGINHYVNVLNGRPYTYGQHFAPHDAFQREFAANARSTVAVAGDLGLQFERMPYLSLVDGITAARTLLPTMFIDQTKGEPLITAMKNYHRKYDETTRTWGKTPEHDWSSHLCDALRNLGASWDLVANNGYAKPKVTGTFAERRYRR